jgi:hypothetical protein
MMLNAVSAMSARYSGKRVTKVLDDEESRGKHVTGVLDELGDDERPTIEFAAPTNVPTPVPTPVPASGPTTASLVSDDPLNDPKAADLAGDPSKVTMDKKTLSGDSAKHKESSKVSSHKNASTASNTTTKSSASESGSTRVVTFGLLCVAFVGLL